MKQPLILFVVGGDRPFLPPGTPKETVLKATVAYHVGEVVRQCDDGHLPVLASYLLDATIAVLIGAGVSKTAALRWIERIAPEAYDICLDRRLIETMRMAEGLNLLDSSSRNSL